MKIDRVNNINKQYLENNIKAKENKNLSKEINKDSGVNIQISDTAKALINKINESNDTAFSEKVEKIRQSIISGNYKVNSEEIADKIINVLESQKGSDIK
ncbi:MAG: flagellar biosynthesis anti-sigma factor FlgM [Tissierellaceae bacterium]|nr:flagellar biosynthesis anti-sigma factor FlgM [Tissierellaceae bacterium]